MTELESQARPFEILLVEDNPGDVLLEQEALRELTVPIRVHLAADGAEAMAFLHRQGLFDSAPHPDLILLDLNLPETSGMAVIQQIKNDPNLRQIPVVVCTSSTDRADIAQSYKLGANCFVTKPDSFDGYVGLMKAIEAFWLKFASLPSR